MVPRLLGGVGIGVTLIGVALLLSLAWQYGYFGPVMQLGAATALATALVGGGFLVRGKDAGNAGSIALVATGIATGYLTLFMASAFYGYVPPIVGMALAAALAVAGLTLASRWQERWLAAPILFWVILLVPTLGAPGLLAGGFVLGLVTASASITGNRSWVPVRVSEVLPTVPVFLMLLDQSPSWAALCTGVAALAAGLAIWSASRALPSATVSLAMMVLAHVPFAVYAQQHLGNTPTALYSAMGALCTSLILLPGQRLARVGATSTAVGAAYLLLAGLTFSGAHEPMLWTLLLALVYLVAGLLAGGISKWIGIVLAGAGLIPWLLERATPWDYSQAAQAYPGAVDLTASVLACLVPILAALMLRRHHAAWAGSGPGRAVLHVLGGMALLTGSLAVLQAGVVIGRQTASGREGLSAGHITLTVLWIALSAIALARALRSSRPMGFVYWGLALAALAVGKLFLYDLGQQPALVRAIGFLIVGVSLLLIGTRYAKALSTVREQRPPLPSEAYPPRPGAVAPPGPSGTGPGVHPPVPTPPGRQSRPDCPGDPS